MTVMLRFFEKLKSLRNIELSRGARVDCHPKCRLVLGEASLITVARGLFRVGYELPGIIRHPSYDHTLIRLGKNARLTILDGAFVGPGAMINVGNNASLTIGRNAFIAHNSSLICNLDSRIGANVSISWDVTIIDDDGHSFYRPDRTAIRRIKRPFLIEDNAGIQMSVLIPAGVKVGKNSIISAGTVLRQDVPENCIAYCESQIKIRSDYSTGFDQLEF